MKAKSGARADRPLSKAVLQTSNAAEPGVKPIEARTASWWIKIVVLLHLFCITVWACPKPSDDLLNGKVKPYGSDVIRIFDQKTLKSFAPLEAYLFTTGTWQYWDMFAPNPANSDWYGDAIVTYRDGSMRRYQYPRMFLLSIPEKYVKERFRKFYERAHDEATYQILPPQFALRIALLNYTDANNPPVKVELYRHWLQIADPGQPQATVYNQNNYYTYEVDQERLRKLAAEKY